MKSQKVYFRIPRITQIIVDDINFGTKAVSTPAWYCVEYPPFNTLTDAELGVLRAKSMLGLHCAADRIFYIKAPQQGLYADIKTDGTFEYPSPQELRNMTAYTPEDLASFLNIKPIETTYGK